MPYSQFTIARVKQDFYLNTVEGVRFFPDSIEPVHPSSRLQAILEDLPWANLLAETLRERRGYRKSPFRGDY